MQWGGGSLFPLLTSDTSLVAVQDPDLQVSLSGNPLLRPTRLIAKEELGKRGGTKPDRLARCTSVRCVTLGALFTFCTFIFSGPSSQDC